MVDENASFEDNLKELEEIVAKLEKGVYFASLFTDDGTAAVVSFLARAEEYKPPYNFEAAAELKIGDRIALGSERETFTITGKGGM